MTLNDQLKFILRDISEAGESISEENKSTFTRIARVDVFDKMVSFIPAEYGMFFVPYPRGYLFESLKARIDEDRGAIDWVFQKIKPYLYCDQLRDVPLKKVDEVNPYWDNGYFGGSDARCAYALVAALKPKRIVEIGIGNSTKFFRKSVNDLGLPTKMIAIDPAPRAEVKEIVDEFIPGGIHTVDKNFFSTLEDGDFLFLDGTHQAINGSDVPKFFMEILPLVKSGVIIQVHDIPLPYQHTDPFHCRYFSEIYVLGAALLYSKDIEVLLPVHYMHKSGFLAEDGGSFWFRKK